VFNLEEQKQEQEFSPEIEEQDNLGLGLDMGYLRRLKLTGDNALIIINYLKELENEIHLSRNYKRMNLTTLVYLSRYLSNKKFKEITRNDIILYLNSLRKTEAADRLHSWISTYNLYLVLLTRFFKWFIG